MSSLEFLKDREWRREVCAEAVGPQFWGFLLVAAALGVACYLLKGPEAVSHALLGDAELLGELLPRIFVALSVAALIWFLLPRDRISGLVGRQSGIKGLVVATLAGAVTPGGPASAYALLALLAASGAERGALVAYITAWSTLGLQRILVWDVPFMGTDFAILRILLSLPLPILAGFIARRLPLSLRIKEDKPATEAGR